MSLEKLQQKLGYKFNDEKLLERALTHKSCNKIYSNERLEFLGDAVMDLIVAEFLCEKFPKINEGELSKIRAAMVNEESFAKLANLINLGENLFLSECENNNGGRKKPSILSDGFEALIGAIYHESGMEKTKEIVIKILKDMYENADLRKLSKDYKTQLQEITQAKFGEIPQYIVKSALGPDHNKTFTMGLILGNKEISVACGKSKKEAEQNAAKIAVELLLRDKK